MNEIKGFTVYREYINLIKFLPKKDQSTLLLSICNYMFFDEEPVLNEQQKIIFENLKRPLDKSKNRSLSGSKTETKQNQNEIKLKSNEKQNEIKMKSKQNQNENKTKTHQDVNVVVNVNDNVNVKDSLNLFEYLETNFNRTISPIEFEELNKWVEELGEEIVRHGIEVSVLNHKNSMKYLGGILKNWKSQGFKTLADIKDNELNHETKNKALQDELKLQKWDKAKSEELDENSKEYQDIANLWSEFQ